MEEANSNPIIGLLSFYLSNCTNAQLIEQIVLKILLAIYSFSSGMSIIIILLSDDLLKAFSFQEFGFSY